MTSSQNSTPIPMWFDDLPGEKSWSRLWYGYTICGHCRGIRGHEPACEVCGYQRTRREKRPLFYEKGREEVIQCVEMGAEGRYEDWVYLRMMEREWKRPVLEEDRPPGIAGDTGMSPKATIVVLFWSYFETRIERLLRAGLAEAPARLVDDALRRYSAIGARLNDFYRIAFDSTYREDLNAVRFGDVWSHLAAIQEKRNAFAHGQPSAIDDALVHKTVEMIRREHESWIAVFNKRGTFSTPFEIKAKNGIVFSKNSEES